MDLSKLSDADLEAFSKNDLKSVSDEGLAIVHEQSKPPPQAPGPESWGHWAIREGAPLVGTVGGGLAGSVAGPVGSVGGAAVGNAAGHEAAGWLNHEIYGDEAPTYNSLNDAKRIGINAAVGAGAEFGGQLIGKGVSAAANSALIKPYLDEAGNLIVGGFNKAGKFVGDKAEKLAVMATGATGKQASTFAPGTGRALLDNGAVKFGRSQAGIAGAAQDVLDSTGEKIGSIIQDLSDKGATASREDLIKGLQSKIDELSGNQAELDTVRKLKSIQEDIAAGPEKPSLKLTEETKRSFQERAKSGDNYNDESAAGMAADVYKQGAENVASTANPEAGQAFKNAKTLYGQLAPAASAANRRAMTTAQSPQGGLLDFVAYGAAGMPGVIAKKVVAPRVNSSLAATANGLSKMLKSTPQAFGKWAGPLSQAAARGETSLNAADYILQQTDPGYRQKRQEMDNPQDELQRQAER